MFEMNNRKKELLEEIGNILTKTNTPDNEMIIAYENDYINEIFNNISWNKPFTIKRSDELFQVNDNYRDHYGNAGNACPFNSLLNLFCCIPECIEEFKKNEIMKILMSKASDSDECKNIITNINSISDINNLVNKNNDICKNGEKLPAINNVVPVFKDLFCFNIPLNILTILSVNAEVDYKYTKNKIGYFYNEYNDIKYYENNNETLQEIIKKNGVPKYLYLVEQFKDLIEKDIFKGKYEIKKEDLEISKDEMDILIIKELLCDSLNKDFVDFRNNNPHLTMDYANLKTEYVNSRDKKKLLKKIYEPEISRCLFNSDYEKYVDSIDYNDFKNFKNSANNKALNLSENELKLQFIEKHKKIIENLKKLMKKKVESIKLRQTRSKKDEIIDYKILSINDLLGLRCEINGYSYEVIGTTINHNQGHFNDYVKCEDGNYYFLNDSSSAQVEDINETKTYKFIPGILLKLEDSKDNKYREEFDKLSDRKEIYNCDPIPEGYITFEQWKKNKESVHVKGGNKNDIWKYILISIICCITIVVIIIVIVCICRNRNKNKNNIIN